MASSRERILESTHSMVLHRPVELARLIRSWRTYGSQRAAAKPQCGAPCSSARSEVLQCEQLPWIRSGKSWDLFMCLLFL